MKYRNGFVSNSSSSSFVAVGFTVSNKTTYKEMFNKLFNLDDDKIKQMMKKDSSLKKKEDIKDIENFCYENSYEIFEELKTKYTIISEDYGAPINFYIIGKYIAEGDEVGTLDEDSFSIVDLIKELTPLKEKINSKSEIKVYVGTKSC